MWNMVSEVIDEPIKLIKSFTATGAWNSRTLSIFSLEKCIPIRSMICPRYSIDNNPKRHFSGFSVILCARNCVTELELCFSFRRRCSHLDRVLLYIVLIRRALFVTFPAGCKMGSFSPMGTRTHSKTPFFGRNRIFIQRDLVIIAC